MLVFMGLFVDVMDVSGDLTVVFVLSVFIEAIFMGTDADVLPVVVL